MSNLPPTPRTLQTTPSLTTMQALLSKAKRADEDVHNYVKATLKPGTKVIFKRDGHAHYAKVVEVIGVPGRTRLTVEKVATLRRLDIHLEDLTGIVQEG